MIGSARSTRRLRADPITLVRCAPSTTGSSARWHASPAAGGRGILTGPAMRIHIHNPADDPLFEFSHTMWDAAVSRSPDIGRGHTVSIGTTDTDFAAAMRDTEALVCDVSVVRAQFPCIAPHLKLLFVTNAGLDRLAPFDWLPPGATLLNNRGTHAVKSGEFAIMAVLMLANRVPEMVTHQRAGQWQKLWGTVLSGKRLTVIGLGTLGGATATHAARFRHDVTGVRIIEDKCKILKKYLLMKHIIFINQKFILLMMEDNYVENQ